MLTANVRPLLAVIVAVFLLMQVIDIVLLPIIHYKNNSVEKLEINPLFNIGISLWFLAIIKLLAAAAIGYFFVYRYFTVGPILRFGMINLLFLLVILYAAVTYNNFAYINIPSEDIVPIPKEQRAEIYAEQIYNMKIVETAFMPKESPTLPLFFQLIFYNLLSFVVWFDSEKGNKEKTIPSYVGGVVD